MSILRRQRQKERGDTFLSRFQRRRKLIAAWLASNALAQLIINHEKDAMKSWVLANFGKYGKWFLTNPAAISTIAIAVVVLWVVWFFLVDIFNRKSNAGFASHIAPKTPVSPKFSATVILVSLACVSIVAFGWFYSYSHPLPVVVGMESGWFAEHFHGNDLYVMVNLKNYSDTPVTVEIDNTLSIEGDVIDTGTASLSIAPWAMHGVYHLLDFKGHTPADPAWLAYHQNKLRLAINVRYKDGQRQVGYHYVGFVMADTLGCPTCAGNLDVVKNYWD